MTGYLVMVLKKKIDLEPVAGRHLPAEVRVEMPNGVIGIMLVYESAEAALNDFPDAEIVIVQGVEP